MFSLTEFLLAFQDLLYLENKEDMFFKCISAIQGFTFIDTQKKNSPPLKRPSSSVDFDKSTGKSNGTGDIFNLLCIYDDNQNFSTMPPSSWATFDCM